MSLPTLVRPDADTVSLRHDGVELLRYSVRPDLPQREGPMPFAHPLRSLSGRVVTGHRPADHPWHKGLAMTSSHLSGQNFWGGGSYTPGAPGDGYVDLPNVGSQRSLGLHVAATGAGFVERLHWVTAAGETWIDEHRTLDVVTVDAEQRCWTLEFRTELVNVSGRELEFGSPASHGRAGAGYGGLAWRGPVDFTGGRVEAEGGLSGADAVRGRRAAWLAFTGGNGPEAERATLVFSVWPGDDEGGRPYWFVRSTPYPLVTPSLAFHRGRPLAPAATLVRRYRLTVADGAWDRAQVAAHLGSLRAFR